MVVSVSCPTPLMTGKRESRIACATIFSLNAHKSSKLPPPRTTKSASSDLFAFAAAICWVICPAACSPCTKVGYNTSVTCGTRRAKVCATSRNAAACGDVTMPIVRMKLGNGFLREESNHPAADNSSLSRKNRSNNVPNPAGRIDSTES